MYGMGCATEKRDHVKGMIVVPRKTKIRLSPFIPLSKGGLLGDLVKYHATSKRYN